MQQWKNKTEVEREIDLVRIGQVLLKRAWLIIAVTLLFGLVAFAYSSLFITPKYRAYFTAYVNNRISTESVQTTTGDMSASMGLVYVYQDIITSRSVLAPAAENSGANYSEIAKGVTAAVSDTAPVVTVIVETESTKLSLAVAQQIAELAPAKVAEVVEGSSMRIIDSPVALRKASSPDITKNTLVGLALGLVLSTLVLVIADLVYDDVQSSADMERRYNLPVIGHIPDMLQAEKNADRYGYRKAGAERK